MGNDISRMSGPPPPLPPAPAPIGVVRALCHPYEITLNMKEQVGWTGDTFHIRDANGQPSFIMKGQAMSFHQRKILQDLSGTPIVNFKHEFSLFKKYSIYAGATSDRLLATIRPHTLMGITADIEFTNHDGTQRLFGLDGNFLSSSATIVDRSNGMPVGRISRKRWNANEMVFGKQTYSVTIAPNVDLALIICICVALDEAKHDNVLLEFLSYIILMNPVHRLRILVGGYYLSADYSYLAALFPEADSDKILSPKYT